MVINFYRYFKNYNHFFLTKKENNENEWEPK